MTTDEIGWLIELTPDTHPAYWSPSIEGDWTSNVDNAVRFARSVDAERVARTLDNDVRVTEHMWPRVETVKP